MKETMHTDEQIKALRDRNALRVAEMIERMGSKYLMHPSNQVKKIKFKKINPKSKAAQPSVW